MLTTRLEVDHLHVEAECASPFASCPGCNQPSQRVHSRYTRRLGDLPLLGRPVRVSLRGRRFRCEQSDCTRRLFAERFRGLKGHPYEQGFDLWLVPEKLAEPLRWKTPKLIFVNSMSDLFHKDVPDDYVEAVCRTMERANWHTYQILTKRSSRMRNMLQTRLQSASTLSHIRRGVSAEDRAHGLPLSRGLRVPRGR